MKDTESVSGILDCYSVLEYFVDHSKEFHVDTNRILLLGVSAGGLMTATTAALAVHGYGTEIPKLNTKLAGQVLIIPVLEYPGGKFAFWRHKIDLEIYLIVLIRSIWYAG